MSDHVDGDVVPEVGAVLTTAQAVALAQWTIDYGTGAEVRPTWLDGLFVQGEGPSRALARTILAWAPVVRAAGAQLDAAVADAIAGRNGDTQHPEYDAWLTATDATEAAVRAYRAAGGDA